MSYGIELIKNLNSIPYLKDHQFNNIFFFYIMLK